MKLAMIGLGRMGSGMAGRLLRGGHDVVVFDQRPEAVRALAGDGARSAASLEEIAQALSPPRVLWVMVPAGAIVDSILERIVPLLAEGDIVVDGGNSLYRDTLRRSASLEERGLRLVDVGISGGIWGPEAGYCLMAGGDAGAIEHLRPALEALAPAPDRGWARVGPSGAGHFVKMVHNGIEYGLMQAYAEGFAILERKQELELDPAQIAALWGQGSVVRSWLLELVERALSEEPGLAGIAPFVEDSGMGRWTVHEALELDVPAPILTQSLIERLTSRAESSFSHRLLAALRAQFGGHAMRRTDTTGGDPP